MRPMIPLSRRGLLKSALALGCSTAASPFLTPIAMAAAPGDARLVVIILRGGMDGLDVVRPSGDRLLNQLRPRLAGNADPGMALDDRFTLHPGLALLSPLWANGELGFVHAVSTPYRDKRSHFDGQDILEAGTPGVLPGAAARTGWLNRLLSVMDVRDARTAFAVGREDLLIFEGRAPHASWSPDARLPLTAQGRLLLEAIYRDDPLFRSAAQGAMDMAQGALVAGGDGQDMASMDGEPRMNPVRAGRSDALAAYAADRLNEDTRIAAFSLTGWDTHRGQTAALGNALKGLEAAITTLRDRLGPNWAKTFVVAMTEFGRTARENGSNGTDHGTGGAMLLAGGAVAGGRVYGKWPGLAAGDLYQNRDLMPTADVRAYAAQAIRGLFGVERSALETTVFPGLDMGDVPHIVA